MFHEGALYKLWRFFRSYGVAVFLVLALAESFIEVYTTGSGPIPQQPPDNFSVVREKAELQWSVGAQEGEMTLQVSLDDPEFSNPVLEKTVTGTLHIFNDLEAGHTYYWRLVQNGKVSPTAWFNVMPYAAKYK